MEHTKERLVANKIDEIATIEDFRSILKYEWKTIKKNPYLIINIKDRLAVLRMMNDRFSEIFNWSMDEIQEEVDFHCEEETFNEDQRESISESIKQSEDKIELVFRHDYPLDMRHAKIKHAYHVIAIHNYSFASAAKTLGITRKTVYKLMNDLIKLIK